MGAERYMQSRLRGNYYMYGIDLFAGAGGMSLGAQMSGVNILSAVDYDKEALRTYAHNFDNHKVVCKDIRNVNGDELGIVKRDAPLILFGGPPCKGFSTSNQRTRTSKNPDNWLFLEYIRLAGEIRPDWIVFENVRGILETEKGLFLQYVTEKLQAIGYNLSWKLLNAADYGIPQNRWRLFIIGSISKNTYKFPLPRPDKPVVVEDAIADLPDLENGAKYNRMPYKSKPQSSYSKKMRGNLQQSSNNLVTMNANYILERYSHIPQGGNWTDIPSGLMANYKDRTRCHTGIYHRLRLTEPSVVIGNYRKNMLIHPLQNRGLSVREAARLQSFPDWFEFEGNIGCQQQQVGNAVPPMLAKAVFDALKTSAQ